MLALSLMFNIVERGSAAYSRIRSLLEEAPVVKDGDIELTDGRGTLAVNIRHFYYPGSEQLALHDVALKLAPGQMLGLVFEGECAGNSAAAMKKPTLTLTKL